MTDRGRDAAVPTEIPGRGWRDVLTRTAREIKSDQVPLLAGQPALGVDVAGRARGDGPVDRRFRPLRRVHALRLGQRNAFAADTVGPAASA